jgi:DnaJ-class molecular chaperone
MVADHYEVLGVERDASPETIKAAYRKLASAYHPDRAEPGEAEDRAAMMARINAANDVLSDPARRARYDETGSSREPTPIELEARANLAELFRAVVLESDAPDVLGVCHRQLESQRAEFKAVIAQNEAQVRRLKRRRELVRVKDGGHNIVHHLVDEKVKKLEAGTAAAQHALKVLAAIVPLLAEYELAQQPQFDQKVTLGSSRRTFDSDLWMGTAGRTPWA